MSDEPTAPLRDFPLVAVLRTAEENVRQTAERLDRSGVLDPESAAQLADVRLWLLSAARRLSVNVIG